MELGAPPGLEERRLPATLFYAETKRRVHVVGPIWPTGVCSAEDTSAEVPGAIAEGSAARPDISMHFRGVQDGAFEVVL